MQREGVASGVDEVEGKPMGGPLGVRLGLATRAASFLPQRCNFRKSRVLPTYKEPLSEELRRSGLLRTYKLPLSGESLAVWVSFENTPANKGVHPISGWSRVRQRRKNLQQSAAYAAPHFCRSCVPKIAARESAGPALCGAGCGGKVRFHAQMYSVHDCLTYTGLGLITSAQP